MAATCRASSWAISTSRRHAGTRRADDLRRVLRRRRGVDDVVASEKDVSSEKRRGGVRASRAIAAAAANGDEYGPNSLGTLGAAIELRSRLQDLDLERRSNRGGRNGDGWEEINGAWVRTPPGRAWGVAHFIGGAVLGSYPHIAYDAVLSRLCDDAGVVVVATPYELGTNHGAIAKECQEKLSKAWSAVAAREGYDPAVTPIFAVGHSLGCKLQLIAACGGDDDKEESDGRVQPWMPNRAGHLFIAFNNATAADSVRLLEKFARELLKKRAEAASGGDTSANEAFDGFIRNLPNLTALAERAAAAAGLAFTPSPEETMDGAKRRFNSPRVKLVSFSDDDLDQNDELAVALRKRYEMTVRGSAPVFEKELPGTHLTPVYFKFDGSKLSPAFGKLGGLSVGDEEAVKALAEEGVRFLKGGT